MPSRCSLPWYYFLYNRNTYGPCAYYRMHNLYGDTTIETGEALMTLFNSPEMQRLRRQLATGDVSGSPCEHCTNQKDPCGAVREASIPHYPHKTSMAFASQRAGLMEAFLAGKIVVDEFPLRLHFNSASDCNLRCIMCDQGRPKVPTALRSEVSFPSLKTLLRDIGWGHVGSLYFAGGEPLFTPDTREFFEYFVQEDVQGTELSFATNGQLLHSASPVLQHVEQLDLRISVDAWGEDYEAIRVGASWPRMLENLQLIAAAKADRPGWRVSLDCVIMRRSLSSMSRLIRLAETLDFDVNFTPVRGNFLEENIFTFPQLLHDVAWETHFEEAMRAAETAFPTTRDHLARLRDQLRGLLDGKITSRSIGHPELFRNIRAFLERTLAGRPFTMYGTSDAMMYFLLNTPRLEGLERVVEHVSQPGDYCGYPLAPASELPHTAGPVVLGCFTHDLARYESALAEARPDATPLYPPFWPEAVERRLKRLAESLAGRRVVGFGAGGASKVILQSSPLRDLDMVAFADNDASRWGSTFLGKPIINPTTIPRHAEDVVVLTQGFEKQIAMQLAHLFQDKIRRHSLFAHTA